MANSILSGFLGSGSGAVAPSQQGPDRRKFIGRALMALGPAIASQPWQRGQIFSEALARLDEQSRLQEQQERESFRQAQADKRAQQEWDMKVEAYNEEKAQKDKLRNYLGGVFEQSIPGTVPNYAKTPGWNNPNIPMARPLYEAGYYPEALTALTAQPEKSNYMVVGKRLYDITNKRWVDDPAGAGGGSQVEFGMTPVPVFNKKTGKWAMGQLADIGGIYVDGKHISETDYEYMPYEHAYVQAAGKGQGKTVGEMRGILPGEINAVGVTVDQATNFLKDPNLEAMIGWSSYIPDWMSPSDIIRLRADLSELTGKSFLAARQLLKGGGQITDWEGRMADKAYNKMQVAIQSRNVEDLKDAIRDFIGAVNSGLEKLRADARPEGGGGLPPMYPSGTGTGTVKNPEDMTDEEIENQLYKPIPYR